MEFSGSSSAACCALGLVFDTPKLGRTSAGPHNVTPDVLLIPVYRYPVYRTPLCFSGQSSWLQVQRSGFDFRHNKIFREEVLEWGPLSLMSTNEELPKRKSSGSGLEIREYGGRDPSR
jgi:hypothetical protein